MGHKFIKLICINNLGPITAKLDIWLLILEIHFSYKDLIIMASKENIQINKLALTTKVKDSE